jgi:hypothetical protein
VPTGLDQSTKKLDSSSTDNNPTGIAHHAHTPTLDTQPLELPSMSTPESSSTESSTGEPQLTSGKNGTEESQDTDTAAHTDKHSTSSEPSTNAVPGLDKFNQLPDGSSSENNPTGIAHHAHHNTEDTQLQELLLITELTSTSTTSRAGISNKDGREDGLELSQTDTAKTTDKRDTT